LNVYSEDDVREQLDNILFDRDKELKVLLAKKEGEDELSVLKEFDQNKVRIKYTD